MIHFLLPRDSDFTVREYLESRGRALIDLITILHYEDLPAHEELPEGAYILGALDQLYPSGRAFVERVCERLRQSQKPVLILNSCSSTLLRLPLLEELARRGLNRHGARRADSDFDGLRFPVFLREEHRHSGSLTPLLETPEQLRAAIARAMLRGHLRGEMLVVEFFDSSDDEGFFHKYAAFIVGSEIIPRSFWRGRPWMLKYSDSEFTPSMILKERDYVFHNPHEEELRRLFETARIDYGRIDYSVRDGRIETWEINTNPVIGRGPRSSTGGPPQRQPMREEAKDYFYRRFREAFERIECVERPAMIPLRGCVAGPWPSRLPTRDEHSPGRRLGLRRALRPLRPILDRIVGALSPILFR